MNTNNKKQAVVWGGLLILFGVMLLLQVYVEISAWQWVLILVLAGLALFGVYLTDRSQLLLLLPAYILWAIAGLIALLTLNILPDSIVPLYALSAVGLPFLVVFLRDRRQWWALIPAYVLLVVGLMIALIETGILGELLIPAYILFAIAVAFFAVYAFNSKNWWALIPAGVLAVVGITFLFVESAAGLIAPVILVIVGVWIIVRQFLRKETKIPDEQNSSVSEIDDPPAS
jgi:predicted membrane protein